MRAIVPLLVWLTLGLEAIPLRADGGTVRRSEQRGRYRLTVFTQPTPCRVGPVDVNVLVQDAATGNPLPDAEVEVRLMPLSGPTIHARATTAAATNQLLQAALFDVPTSGLWRVEVWIADEPAPTDSFDLAVEEAPPFWRSYGLWIGWPGVAIVLFAVHQYLAQRRSQDRQSMPFTSSGRAP